VFVSVFYYFYGLAFGRSKTNFLKTNEKIIKNVNKHLQNHHLLLTAKQLMETPPDLILHILPIHPSPKFEFERWAGTISPGEIDLIETSWTPINAYFLVHVRSNRWDQYSVHLICEDGRRVGYISTFSFILI
jgi:hypothetical protein